MAVISNNKGMGRITEVHFEVRVGTKMVKKNGKV